MRAWPSKTAASSARAARISPHQPVGDTGDLRVAALALGGQQRGWCRNLYIERQDAVLQVDGQQVLEGLKQRLAPPPSG